MSHRHPERTQHRFISLQARDLKASQAFFEKYLGLVRSPAGPPHADGHTIVSAPID